MPRLRRKGKTRRRGIRLRRLPGENNLHRQLGLYEMRREDRTRLRGTETLPRLRGLDAYLPPLPRRRDVRRAAATTYNTTQIPK